MGHQQGLLAAVVGKHRGNNFFGGFRGLILGAAALLAASLFSAPSHAQSGPFNGLAGVWSGGGTVTLDDGSSERIRCRVTYAVGEGGHGLNQTLTCASDSYKFDLRTNVTAEGNRISGSWSEISRNISGTIEGTGSPGQISVRAAAAGFNANISVATRGNRQSISISADSAFKAVNMSLSRS